MVQDAVPDDVVILLLLGGRVRVAQIGDDKAKAWVRVCGRRLGDELGRKVDPRDPDASELGKLQGQFARTAPEFQNMNVLPCLQRLGQMHFGHDRFSPALQTDMLCFGKLEALVEAAFVNYPGHACESPPYPDGFLIGVDYPAHCRSYQLP